MVINTSYGDKTLHGAEFAARIEPRRFDDVKSCCQWRANPRETTLLLGRRRSATDLFMFGWIAISFAFLRTGAADWNSVDLPDCEHSAMNTLLESPLVFVVRHSTLLKVLKAKDDADDWERDVLFLAGRT